MIVDFSVRNFGPFRDRAVLSMEPTLLSDDEHPIQHSPTLKNGLLKSAAIFGANASGKTFLVEAIGCLKEIVGRAHPDGDFLSEYIPFALSRKTASEPTSMELRMVIDGVLYSYGISYNEERIVSETLYHSPNGRRALIFRRGEDDKGIDPDVLAKVSPATTYLYMAADYNDPACSAVLREIRRISVVFQGREQDTRLPFMLARNDPEIKRMMLSALDAADLGIRDFYGEDRIIGSYIPKHDPSGGAVVRKATDIRLLHVFRDADVGDMAFPISMESNGTIEMFSIMGPISSALKDGGTVIVDEFGSDLHPLLTRWLIGLFNTESNTNGAQLIVNTHDISLLDIRELFRRDQIWFTSKDRDNGAAVLYSLAQIKGVRKKSDIRDDYLMGRFNAVPSVIGVSKL